MQIDIHTDIHVRNDIGIHKEIHAEIHVEIIRKFILKNHIQDGFIYNIIRCILKNKPVFIIQIPRKFYFFFKKSNQLFFYNNKLNEEKLIIKTIKNILKSKLCLVVMHVTEDEYFLSFNWSISKSKNLLNSALPIFSLI